ncbi:hypothetical protein B4102_3404 [Heyndrickxia sporothermodurans]|uniref:HTH cro/C1-type domain-containing protein n=1 Tax=Heyndrickxia sporothermodurans TaxID=46224 RepID=A0A150KUV1_9BACI|nr:helix-turn-helix domain-containing protein [Heyndrickxia sporothermodurans]KYD03486.1 hypothetical protein B4102_3404 [Heyndrickxia sporothermodurans]
MSLGSRLKKEREKRKWSQIAVAKKIGITNAVLSNYERDVRDPDTETLRKFAELYEVSSDYLLGRKEDPTYNKEDEEFKAFINDPELRRWYKKLPENDEEDLRKLRKMWEIIKSEENK